MDVGTNELVAKTAAEVGAVDITPIAQFNTTPTAVPTTTPVVESSGETKPMVESSAEREKRERKNTKRESERYAKLPTDQLTNKRKNARLAKTRNKEESFGTTKSQRMD